MEKKWTLPNSADILDIKPGRIREWVNYRFIDPTWPAAHRGDTSFFSKSDLCKFQLFDHLLKRGFYRKQAGEIVKKYQDKDFLCVSSEGGELLTTWYDKGEKLELAEQDDVFVVNLSSIRETVEQAIKKKIEPIDLT